MTSTNTISPCFVLPGCSRSSRGKDSIIVEPVLLLFTPTRAVTVTVLL